MTTTKYVDVVFMQGDEADEVLDKLCNRQGDSPVYSGATEESVAEAVEYLSQWDYGTETDAAHTLDYNPVEHTDNVVERDGYMLTWNLPYGHVGLYRETLTS